MKIEHLAIWTKDLEIVKEFYVKYFGMQCSDKYTNTVKNFSSYFLSFKGDKTRLEIMNRPDIKELDRKHSTSYGLTHFSISVGSKSKVDGLTEKLSKNDSTLFLWQINAPLQQMFGLTSHSFWNFYGLCQSMKMFFQLSTFWAKL